MRFSNDSLAIGVVPHRAFPHGRRRCRVCRIRRCVVLQQRRHGEQQNSGAHTAAHRTLPFGTMVQVTNTDNGRSITVRINDRGPFLRGRVIDLAPADASQLGFSDLAPVDLTVLSMPVKSAFPR